MGYKGTKRIIIYFFVLMVRGVIANIKTKIVEDRVVLEIGGKSFTNREMQELLMVIRHKSSDLDIQQELFNQALIYEIIYHYALKELMDASLHTKNKIEEYVEKYWQNWKAQPSVEKISKNTDFAELEKKIKERIKKKVVVQWYVQEKIILKEKMAPTVKEVSCFFNEQSKKQNWPTQSGQFVLGYYLFLLPDRKAQSYEQLRKKLLAVLGHSQECSQKWEEFALFARRYPQYQVLCGNYLAPNDDSFFIPYQEINKDVLVAFRTKNIQDLKVGNMSQLIPYVDEKTDQLGIQLFYVVANQPPSSFSLEEHFQEVERLYLEKKRKLQHENWIVKKCQGKIKMHELSKIDQAWIQRFKKRIGELS